MMVDLQLRYGHGFVSLQIPEVNLTQEVQPKKQQASKDIVKVIQQALNNPKSIELDEVISNRRVGVLIEDGTRAEPHEILIEELAARLHPAKECTFIITTGSHEIDSERNREIIQAIHTSATRHKLHPYSVIVHDGLGSPCELIGATTRGTQVRVNEIVMRQEAFVIAADMKNHYFAGYSNAIKNFLPGVCNFATIEANHSLALEPESTFGRHPLHPNPLRRSNPVAEDMLEAMHLILKDRPVFLLATITSGPFIIWSASGDLAKVTREGCQKIDETASFTVTPSEYTIVTPGGFPQDESLYNAQRGLELTKNAVKDEGEILFLAECPKGIAPTPKAQTFFYDKLVKPLPEVIKSIRNQYVLYSHKAYKFAELIQRVGRIRMHTSLAPDQVASAHLDFVSRPQAVIDEWIKEDPNTQILVFHDANKIAVYS